MNAERAVKRGRVLRAAGVVVKGVVACLVLGAVGACGPLHLTVVGGHCLNASLEDCLHASDPVAVSKSADLRIYQLTAPVDLQLLDYQSLLAEKTPVLDRAESSHLDVTVLPGETVAVEIPREEKVRYLLFFFQGREQGGERAWLRLVRFPLLGRRMIVELDGFSVSVERRK